jgi:proline iminopeptidase
MFRSTRNFVNQFVFQAKKLSAAAIPIASRALGSSTRRYGAALMGCVGIACSFSSSALSASCSAVTLDSVLFPATPKIDEGYIRVSEKHTIYYHVYGNPKGKPVLFVHGGPGGGTDPMHARFFDPAAYRIVLVDQRGCGKSTPFADLTDNTTWDSVRDFERVRMRLGIKKWQVFGGSWGSTLSLAYSQVHPERVTELVLRGIFLLREKEVQFFYQHGSSFIFPDEWEHYENEIPEKERDDYIAAYGRRLRGELGEDAMRSAAKSWSIWEGRTSNLEQAPWEQVKAKFGGDDFSLAFARIENHYFTNKGFFPRDGYLLEKEQIDKIRHIPTTIVQGRYDCVCPMRSAWDLKKAFPEAELNVVIAGHSAFDPLVAQELVKATNKYKKV